MLWIGLRCIEENEPITDSVIQWKIPPIVLIGDESQAGTYILRIHLKEDTSLQFGRFKKGKLISLPAGDYAYVGSALSEKGGDFIG